MFLALFLKPGKSYPKSRAGFKREICPQVPDYFSNNYLEQNSAEIIFIYCFFSLQIKDVKKSTFARTIS